MDLENLLVVGALVYLSTKSSASAVGGTGESIDDAGSTIFDTGEKSGKNRLPAEFGSSRVELG